VVYLIGQEGDIRRSKQKRKERGRNQSMVERILSKGVKIDKEGNPVKL
jgi:hypothetical protein